MSIVINQAPFLKTTRTFPEDTKQLLVELSKEHIDIANCVNDRIIGNFAILRPAVTGEGWFLQANRKQQTLRQVYQFTAAGSIAHGINLSQIAGFTRIWGTFTNGTNYYPLPYVDVSAANNQVNIVINSTNIVITAGGGSPPSISSGIVILEWLSLG